MLKKTLACLFLIESLLSWPTVMSRKNNAKEEMHISKSTLVVAIKMTEQRAHLKRQDGAREKVAVERTEQMSSPMMQN